LAGRLLLGWQKEAVENKIRRRAVIRNFIIKGAKEIAT
jgi:hypothetical protein